jgi:hypothetical protein
MRSDVDVERLAYALLLLARQQLQDGERANKKDDVLQEVKS